MDVLTDLEQGTDDHSLSRFRPPRAERNLTGPQRPEGPWPGFQSSTLPLPTVFIHVKKKHQSLKKEDCLGQKTACTV